MATPRSSRTLALSLLTAILPLTDALRASPGSPCESACTDSFDLSPTDPDFLDSQWKSIVCLDEDYNGSKGQQMQSCMSCLQSSTYQKDDDSDLDWFIYNLKYSVDYCVFGYPNSTGFESGPCSTSEACGALSNALEDGIPYHNETSQYGYCDIDGQVILSNDYNACMACLQADGKHDYLANFMVALETGCQQKPLAGEIIGLNATIFSNDTVEGINEAEAAAEAESRRSRLSAAGIAGIVVGAIVVAAIITGCVFIQIRKLQKRKRLARNGRSSSLSIRCPSQFGAPGLQEGYYDDRFFTEEKPASAHGVAITTTAVIDEFTLYNQPSTSMGSKESMNAKPTVITTSLPPPSPAHTSPRRFSPVDLMTPTSAVSNRSNMPLLNSLSSTISPQSPKPPSYRDLSPRVNQTAWPGQNSAQALWEEEMGESSRRELVKKKSKGSALGSPVQVEFLQTSFPPPPKQG